MRFLKQVDKSHYEFDHYVCKKRWMSIWHQIDEVIRLKPMNVLEIGPGPGLFKAIATVFGVDVETLDIDTELNPDHVASVFDLPFNDNSYSVVCAFQMLEHLLYDYSLKAFTEMVRVSKKYVIISLPDAKRLWRYLFYVPKIGEFNFYIPNVFSNNKEHFFDGEHYWEVNKKGYPLKKIIQDFLVIANAYELVLLKSYRVPEFPYHRFFVFAKKNC